MFESGALCLCRHGNLIYNAKILEKKDGKYLVHYKGWRSNWDEWVQEDQLLENTIQNRKLMAEQKAKVAKKPILRKFTTGDLKIPIPLKSQLWDDRAMIMDNLLCPLPRSPCVSEILERFSRKRNDPDLKEFCSGLLELFEEALPTCLLYPIERLQLFHQSDVCKTYGAEHLLRLFVFLPSLMQQANVDMETWHTTANLTKEFLHWLMHENYFIRKYKGASLDYMNELIHHGILDK